MNYPVWDITSIGGGTLIALISIIHVYIAHFAVGGGLFIWYTDRHATRTGNVGMKDYVHSHANFFLLLTMVLGAVTGVGIWFIISLVHPSATSFLIHEFVFGWATEWVFFLAEIVALLIYYYRFDKMSDHTRQRIALFYFIFAWLSLFVINGILSFMLTPGGWIASGSFWHGFFNPTFVPSLIFRSAMAVMIAGIFAHLTALRQKDQLRDSIMAYSRRWILLPIPVLLISIAWYWFAVPASFRERAFSTNPQTTPFLIIFITGTVLLLLFSVMGSRNRTWQKISVATILVIGLAWIGGFEYMREIARKPWVIGNYMYSSSMTPEQMKEMNTGFIDKAKWAVKEGDALQKGRSLFMTQCATCHTVGGIRNDIIPRTADFTYTGMQSQIFGQGKVLDYMPPFAGTKEEAAHLAAWIVKGLHGKDLTELPTAAETAPLPELEPLPFNTRTDDYVLMAWNDLGMHCLSDSSPWFIILPPANTLEAQLIKRGAKPEIITDGVEIEYAVQEGFEEPSKHVRFWEFAEVLFGKKIPKDVGIAGKGMTGTLERNGDTNAFIAHAIPVVPYNDDGDYNPYPWFTIVAKDAETGEELARTRAITPVSNEMGCRNCHGGDWRKKGSGIADKTAQNILRAHDRISGTSLLADAQAGKPQLCQACHPDPALGAEGKPGHLTLSTAIHGWHANYMHVEGGQACVMCHPASAQGNTQCNRGIHSQLGMDCTQCHGQMAEHAAALIKGDEGNRRKGARLLRNLSTSDAFPMAEINPRGPWMNEPDCLTCHEGFKKPEGWPSGFNRWTSCGSELYRMRTGTGGVRCEACHGSPHAVYPAKNPYGKNRDNQQPLQYMGLPYPMGSNGTCETCHRKKMQQSVHHPNMNRPFRNDWVKDQ